MSACPPAPDSEAQTKQMPQRRIASAAGGDQLIHLLFGRYLQECEINNGRANHEENQ